ncbi:hypothetical protein [Jiulongibacter sp. NS-SX5]|uniref:hypothetical protein n=1 Tax=Jiulongibacter sp. NS-SX5 TaxID=3463854 RepID=UPI00405A088B
MLNEDNLKLLKAAMEAKLGWGKSSGWGNYDFEKLSEVIFQETEVSLSVSTLKRFFGKVKYEHKPSMTTLNALSEYVGYADWRAFEAEQNEPSPIQKEEVVSVSDSKAKKVGVFPFVLLAGLLVMILGVFLMFRSKPNYTPEDFSFSSKTIQSSGLPNSVVFDYDASKADENDSVFISQSWDVRRKVQVSKKGESHSSIYYYPGYFIAKLLIGNTIIKEHEVQILSDGWLAANAVPFGEPPHYFNEEEILSNDEILVSEEILSTAGISLEGHIPEIRIFNQKDISAILSDDFEFETEVKSLFKEGEAVCQPIQIYLIAKDDVMIIPLSQPGCIGDLYYSAFGYGVHSEAADLSNFGVNTSEWVKVKVKSEEGEINVYVNEGLAYTSFIKNTPTEIVGVQYRFLGPASVRNTMLKNDEKEEVF